MNSRTQREQWSDSVITGISDRLARLEQHVFPDGLDNEAKSAEPEVDKALREIVFDLIVGHDPLWFDVQSLMFNLGDYLLSEDTAIEYTRASIRACLQSLEDAGRLVQNEQEMYRQPQMRARTDKPQF